MTDRLRRHGPVAALWALAIVALGGIWLWQRGDGGTDLGRSAAEAPVRTPDTDRAPPRASRSPARGPRAPRPGPPALYRLDARRTGRSPYTAPPHVARRWRYETGGRITAQAVLGADGTVYVGAHDGGFHALRDGEQVWRRALGGPIYSTAALSRDGRTLYVGCDADRFYALDARTGAIRWSLQTDGDADTSAVVRSDGSLLFAAGRDLWAVAPDGRARWRFRARAKIYSSPAVDDDGTIYFGAQDDRFYALDREGRMRWSFRTQNDNDASPALGDDGTVFFGSDDEHVYALSPDGELRWSADLDGYVRAALAVARDGTVIASTFGPRPRIVGLDPTTGDQRWSYSTEIVPSRDLGVHSAPTIGADGTIYVGTPDDFLYALSSTGRLRWVFALGGDVDGAPVIGPDGTLYVGSDDRGLWALGPAPDAVDAPGAQDARDADASPGPSADAGGDGAGRPSDADPPSDADVSRAEDGATP